MKTVYETFHFNLIYRNCVVGVKVLTMALFPCSKVNTLVLVKRDIYKIFNHGSSLWLYIVWGGFVCLLIA